MIQLNNLIKRYQDCTAVNDITLEVKKGEFCVLVGTSGCGKSTTLKMINRLIEPTAGTIEIDGTDVMKFKPELLRRRIGYVIQSIGLFPHLTVEQNIAVVPRLLKWEDSHIRQRALELLELFHLQPDQYRHKYPNQLSGGEAQRVGVARALAANPDILLMDEPFGALDPITRESLQIELARIQQELGKTIVFVTHDIDEAVRLSTRMAVLDRGKIIQYDVPENLLLNPVNSFVRDFLGADRGLKRLSRLRVENYLRRVQSLKPDQRLESLPVELQDGHYVWVTGEDDRLMGWVDHQKANPGAVAQELAEKLDPDFTLSPDLTLKEALSRMLWQGSHNVPVVSASHQLLGEIHLLDLLKSEEVEV